MSRTYTTSGAGYIRCPFFRAHNKTAIVCEGLIDGTSNCVRFRTGGEKSFHQHTYCENQYQRCEICLSVLHWKWEEDDDR